MSEQGGAGIPAPYGGACTSCAKAKCRCIYRAGKDESCERCHRLGRRCTLPVSSRRWNERQTNSLRIAQLEGKVDDILSLLQKQTLAGSDLAQSVRSDSASVSGVVASSSSTGPSAQSHRDPSPDDTSPGDNEHSEATNDTTPDFCGNDDTSPSNGAPAPAANAPTFARPGGAWEVLDISALSKQISPEEAQQNLSSFLHDHVFGCPFFYLAPSVTSQQLLEARPFMWFNIMTVMAKSVRQQHQMNMAIRHYIAEKMVLENEKGVDLLYGLLIYISWSHTHRKTKAHLTLMGTLVQSLIYDLVLHKPHAESSNVSFFTEYDCALPPVKDDQSEARRVVLGAYLVTSIVSQNQKRLEPLKWTPFLDECLEGLEKHPEWLGDRALLVLVRYQLVLDQLAQNQGGIELPAPYLDALRAQVEKTRRQTPLELESEANIAGLSLYTDLVLHETAAPHDKPPASSATHHHPPPSFARYNTLDPQQRHAQLAAQQLATVRRWLDLFAGIPPPRYWALPFSFWSQLAHVVIMLFRLASSSTSSAPLYAATAAVEIDVHEVCDRLAVAFAEASAARVQDDDDCGGSNNRDDENAKHPQQRRRQGGGSYEPDFFMKCHVWMARLRDRWAGREDGNTTARGDPQAGVAAPEYVFRSAQGVPKPVTTFTGLDAGDGMNMDPFGPSFFQIGDAWQGDILSAAWDSQTPQFFP